MRPAGIPPAEIVRAWEQAAAVKVGTAPGPADGPAVQLQLRDRAAPLVFTQAPGEPDVLLRADLGLAYHMAPDSAALALPTARGE